ncbi:MAG: PHP domain-containing protein [Dehalococcoidia bacterium]
MVIDLHVHTTKGGYDSLLSLPQLIEDVERRGLDGACVTEHNSAWGREELERFTSDHDVVIVGGMEVETDVGHIVILGLDRYISGIHKASQLRRIADEIGGFLIAVHPFRRFFDPEELRLKPVRSWSQVSEEAITLPILGVVDEIEVLNGCCTERENSLALQVARRLGLRGTAGSDAHSTHGIGCFCTVFEREIRDERDLIAELKAGRFYPAQRLPSGEIIPGNSEASPG